MNYWPKGGIHSLPLDTHIRRYVMSAMFVFSESDIRAAATVQSYQRGVEYCRAGAVSDLVQRGNLLTAQVEGSTVPYYQV